MSCAPQFGASRRGNRVDVPPANRTGTRPAIRFSARPATWTNPPRVTQIRTGPAIRFAVRRPPALALHRAVEATHRSRETHADEPPARSSADSPPHSNDAHVSCRAIPLAAMVSTDT